MKGASGIKVTDSQLSSTSGKGATSEVF